MAVPFPVIQTQWLAFWLASHLSHHSPLFLWVLLLKCLSYSSFLFNLYLYHPILLCIYQVNLQGLLIKCIPGATTFFSQWRYKREMKHGFSPRVEKSGQRAIKLQFKQMYNLNTADSCNTWRELGACEPVTGGYGRWETASLGDDTHIEIWSISRS